MLPARFGGILVGLLVAGMVGPAAADRVAPPPPTDASPWIGIGIRDGFGHVIITAIHPDTPAAQAGLTVGDEIHEVDGVAVRTTRELIGTVGNYAAGEPVVLTVVRGERSKKVGVRLAQKPSASELAARTLVGKPAPDFDLPVASGDGPGKLSAYRGRAVIAVLFSSHGCLTCPGFMRDLGKLVRKRRRDLAIIGVAREPRNAVRAFAGRAGLGFTMVAELVDEELQDQYTWRYEGSTDYPLVVVIDRGGIVRFAATIDESDRTGPRVAAAVTMLIDQVELILERILGPSDRHASR